MTKPIAAVIFDMDGTLVDSEVVWEAAEADMFAQRGLQYTDEVRQQVIGLRLDEFFEKLIHIYGLNETVAELQAELIERMLKLIPTQLQAKAGAREILDTVIELGLPYCIASSSPLIIIDAVIASQNWQSIMPLRYSADDVARGKPAPDVYLYAAEQLNVDPTACMALEDSPNGARSAVAAGMMCVVVPDFHTQASAFADITPHVYPSLTDVITQIKTLV